MKPRTILASKGFRLTVVILAGFTLIFLAGEWRVEVRHRAAVDELERNGATATSMKIDWTKGRIPDPIRKWMPKSLRETHRVASVGLQHAVINDNHFKDFIPYLNDLRELHTVYISGSGLGDETLRELVKFPHLRVLWAFGTSANQETVQELRKTHPYLEIGIANP